MVAGILGGIATAYTIAEKLGLTKVLADKIGGFVDQHVPDPAQRAQATLDLQRLVHDEKMQAAQLATDLAKDQLAAATTLNLEDAKSGSAFRSDWRSFIGWIVAVGVAYGLLMQPLGTWLMTFVSAWFDINFPPPPPVEWSQVITILGILLTGAGLSVATKVVGSK